MASLPSITVSAFKYRFCINIVNVAVCILVLHPVLLSAQVDKTILLYEELYNTALNAYANEEWETCTSFMQQAISEFNLHGDIVAHCYQACQYEKGQRTDTADFSQLALFDILLTKGACIKRCKEAKTRRRRRDQRRAVGVVVVVEAEPEENEGVLKDFETLETYNYLQLCAYKSSHLELAVSAAYTFLSGHPDHEDMQGNVNFYQGMSGVKESYFYDLESRPHQEAYREGLTAYAEEDWWTATRHIQKATRLYYEAFDRCAARCEHQGGATDRSENAAATGFYGNIAAHLVALLGCKRRCVSQQATVVGNEVPDYLLEHYNHLQFAFYKINKMKLVATSVATYLLMNATDQTMAANKKFYLADPALHESDFLPDEDALLYFRQRLIEDQLLLFAETAFVTSDTGETGASDEVDDSDTDAASLDVNVSDDVTGDDDTPDNKGDMDTNSDTDSDANSDTPVEPSDSSTDDTATDSVSDSAGDSAGDPAGDPAGDAARDETRLEMDGDSNPFPLAAALFGRRDASFLSGLAARLRRQGVTLTAQAAALHGSHRVTADGLLSQGECTQLMELAEKGAQQGDGYSGYGQFSSPHTNHEMFEGLTVSRATEMTLDGTISADDTELFISASEKGRVFLENYFRLQRPLYFHFTHLVCRTALPRGDVEADVLSHPVHSDNCIIMPDGSCLKEKPAYTSRDLTGLIYLNDDFEGGEFFWAHRNQTIQKGVSPKCGRFVGFESSDYHGVKAVGRGRRCAVALWFTFDGDEREEAHEDARSVLTQLHAHTYESGSQEVAPSAELRELLATAGYTLSMTGSELGGRERFVADGVATQGECLALVQLATESGIVGDGYADSDSSAHSQHEIFTGLTLTAAVKLATSFRVSAESVQVFLDVSERARHLVATYFNLPSPLYFAFSHLVCRRALDDTNVDRVDLSHAIHADNCLMQVDGTCLKERPAYTERDYSAIVYLNNNFSGGEFFFTDTNKVVQSQLTPRPGRIVAFDAASYHGVRAVKSGERCAVALWFTLDYRQRDVSHSAARDAIKAAWGRARGPSRGSEL